MRREATIQQEGPVESIAVTRLFAIVNLVLAAAIALALTAAQVAQISDWSAAVGGILVLIASALVYLRAASPFRAPVRRPTFVVVIALLLVGVVLDGIARTGSASSGGWAIAVVPVTLFALSNGRPAVEILIGGTVLSVGLVVTAIALAPAAGGHRPLLSVALDSIITAVPATIATAAFVHVTVRAMRREFAEGGVLGERSDGTSGTQLERELVQLLTDVVDADRVTSATSSRAQVLATGLRSRLVADQERDWISELGIHVTDEEGYAERMSLEQRTTLRGLLAALPITGPADPGWAHLSGQDHDATLELEVPIARRPDSMHLGPAVLMLRTVFPGSRFRAEDGRVRVTTDFSVA